MKFNRIDTISACISELSGMIGEYSPDYVLDAARGMAWALNQVYAGDLTSPDRVQQHGVWTGERLVRIATDARLADLLSEALPNETIRSK